jgi:16S rRNA (guanine527-N7)-methyltransferase
MLEDPLYKSVSKISDPNEIAIKHFLDCLIPFSLNIPFEKSKTITDLGTGGGFPCLPFAIMLPNPNFFAVDSRKKSVEFVVRMSESIGLKNVTGVHSRIEDLGHDSKFREKSDFVICRALSSVRTLAEYTLPLTKNEGYSFYLKGPKLEEEVTDAANAFSILGIKPENLNYFRISPPKIPFERNFLLIKKESTIPVKYPRKSGLPNEKPL